MKKYYQGTKAILLAGAILMAVGFIMCLFLEEGPLALIALGMAGLLFVYLNDIVKAERWYECMNDYWDAIQKQEKVIDAYKDLDAISNNALNLAQECNDSNRTYLSTLSDMNKLACIFLEDIDDETADEVNRKMGDTNLYLRNVDGKWKLYCRQPW